MDIGADITGADFGVILYQDVAVALVDEVDSVFYPDFQHVQALLALAETEGGLCGESGARTRHPHTFLYLVGRRAVVGDVQDKIVHVEGRLTLGEFEVLRQSVDTHQVGRITIFDRNKIAAIRVYVAAVVVGAPADAMRSEWQRAVQRVRGRLDIHRAVVPQVYFVGVIDETVITVGSHRLFGSKNVAFRATARIQAKRQIGAGREPLNALGTQRTGKQEQEDWYKSLHV